MAVTVGGIFYYPVKSAKRKSLTWAGVDARGILHDREWVVVDDRGMFVAQRQSENGGVEIRTMCLINADFQGDKLILTAPKMAPILIPETACHGHKVEVQIWKHRCWAVDQGEPASHWLSEFLGRERPGHYRLMRMAETTIRRASLGASELAFADSYPFLILSQASLNDLNRRLPEALPMSRFRPNLVLDGCEPYEEDHMALIRIGGNVFLEGKGLCIRCPITTTNQNTAARGPEPLRTLATYRRNPGDGGGVVFGRKFNHLNFGLIRVGDPVQVVAWD